MTEILDGRIVAHKMREELKTDITKLFPEGDKYLAIVFLWDNAASKTYVAKKKKLWETIGMRVEIFGQGEEFFSNDEGLQFYQNQQYDSVPKVLDLINYLNYDKDCVGIIVQLPLPKKFQAEHAKILSSVQPHKDVDGLGGVINGLSRVGIIDFLPATPRAVIELMKHYNYDILKGKTVAILGQSNLVGKPLATELMKMWATVYITNASNNPEKTKAACQSVDYIVSATGQIHLVDESFLCKEKDQILIDVGYGFKDGKPVGDVNIEKIKDKVHAYTPVPGGVGPITVACLFKNIVNLQRWKMD